MQLHLDEIAARVTAGAHAILILDQAGDAVDFHLVIFRFGATMELGRSERTSHGVDAANTPDRKPR
jgi:hypothetical protein